MRFLPFLPNLLLCKSWMGSDGGRYSCGGTDSGTFTSPVSYNLLLISLNVVNKCCMKASCQHLAGNGPNSLS